MIHYPETRWDLVGHWCLKKSAMVSALRGKWQGPRFPWAMFLVGGLIDYLTIALMFAGLSQRLREQQAMR